MGPINVTKWANCIKNRRQSEVQEAKKQVSSLNSKLTNVEKRKGYN